MEETRREAGTPRQQAEVWTCPARRADPELDESVTAEPRHPSAMWIRKTGPHIEFRLPTYWCAANFSS